MPKARELKFSKGMKISIIIPVLNEALTLTAMLSSLRPYREEGHEVIVVDGGSHDGSAELSRPFVDKVIPSPRGRARQLNAGAMASSGDVLLFLHADTYLPPAADQLILRGLRGERKEWGRFDVRLSGTHCLLRMVEWLMNLRSRITRIATGDQALFVSREAFEAVGGFPDIDLMEDIALSKTLKRRTAPLCLREQVLASSRRWERNGILHTILVMWSLRLAYFLGASPKHLASRYGRLKTS
jgi:rSAM/selenodomain-associated transferase 2